jgi:Zn-dependent M28 family amino/carboxypeptidase
VTGLWAQRLVGWLAVVGFATAGGAIASAQQPTRPGCAVPALDSAQLLTDVSRLADDSMRGRRIGTPGNARARDFLAARFDALGLGRVGAGRIQVFPVAQPRLGDANRGYNVIGVVPGTVDTARFVVVSAHFDHLGVGRPVGGDSIYNGADDNASGASALLVLAAYFMRHRPRQSLLFLATDGEEEGDLGSAAFVADPPVALDRILLDVNLDMVGRNIHDELFAAGPDRYPALRPVVDATAACSPITLRIGHDGRGSAGDDWTDQSDQASFNAHGIPFVYFGEEDHPDYHRPSDTANRLMPAFYIAAVRTVADFLIHFDTDPIDARVH